MVSLYVFAHTCNSMCVKYRININVFYFVGRSTVVTLHLITACDRTNLLDNGNLHPQQAEQSGHH